MLHEQPRSRGGRAARGPDRLRRQRQGGAQLGLLRRIVETLRRLENDETLLVQSGKPVGVFRTHDEAPRVLIANAQPGAALGHLGRVPPPRGAGPDDVRPDDGRLVDLHRHAGHPAGHLRDLRRVRPPALRRHAGGPAGRDRRARRHGRRAAAGGDDERRRVPRRRRRSQRASERRVGQRLLRPARPTTSTRRSRLVDRARSASRRALSVGLVGNIAEVLPELARRGIVAATCVTDQTSAHDLRARLHPGRPTRSSAAAALRERDPRGLRGARCSTRWCRTSRRCSRSRRAGAIAFDYGNNLRGQVADHRGMREAFDIPGFVPEFIRPLFCRGAGPFRWAALSGDPADIAVTDEAVLETFPEQRAAGALDRGRRGRRCTSRACRRASAGSSTASAPSWGCEFNWLVKQGQGQGAARDRPRPPRHRLGGVAQSRDRGR